MEHIEIAENIRSKKALWLAFATILIDMLGVGILVPVFPMLILPASTFKVIPDSWSIHDGLIMSGWLLAAFPLTQFFFSPLLGQLSDRYGRKVIFALSISGTALSYFLFAL